MVIREGIIAGADGALSFGDYSRKDKLKVDGFEHNGSLYKVKTHDAVTRLEKNEALFLETVPGSAIHDFKAAAERISFMAEAQGQTSFTLELEPDTGYELSLNGEGIDTLKTSPSGKLMFDLKLNAKPVAVTLEKA